MGRHVNAAYRVCDGLRQNKIVRVGKNSGLVLSPLCAKVHEILGQRSYSSCFPSPLPYCLHHVSLSKVVKKPNKCKRLLPPIYKRWTTSTSVRQIVSATYRPPIGKKLIDNPIAHPWKPYLYANGFRSATAAETKCFSRSQLGTLLIFAVDTVFELCLCFREHHEKIVDYTALLMRKSESEFFKFMRVTKKTFVSLVDQLENTERFGTTHHKAGQPRRPTDAATAMSVTLWYLGNLTSQREIAERFHISQGQLSVVVRHVVDFLCSLAPTVIHWPSVEEMTTVENDFQEMANFPGVLGAIDGCHIRILPPDYCQNDYLDRNHNHTVNLLAVCDANKKFTYCFAGFPGSVHDQRVFANSQLGTVMDTRAADYFPSAHYHILGDSAFQLQVHVMVPYKDTGCLTAKELYFNRKLSQTRRVIENSFGFLKGRFRRLKYMECKLSRVPDNVIACCVLHNITVCDQSEIDLLTSDIDCQVSNECDVPATTATSDLPTGKQKRDRIADMFLQCQ